MLLMAMLASCKTYYITPDSLKNQLKAADAQLQPGYEKNDERTFNNGLVKITVTDKQGHACEQLLTLHAGAKLTDATGRHAQVYLNTLFLIGDDQVSGRKSHFFPTIKPMQLSSVREIKVSGTRNVGSAFR